MVLEIRSSYLPLHSKMWFRTEEWSTDYKGYRSQKCKGGWGWRDQRSPLEGDAVWTRPRMLSHIFVNDKRGHPTQGLHTGESSGYEETKWGRGNKKGFISHCSVINYHKLSSLKHTVYYLSVHDFGSGVQVWLSWVLCSGSREAAVQVSAGVLSRTRCLVLSP